MKVIVPVEHVDRAMYFCSQQQMLTAGLGTRTDGHLELTLMSDAFPGAKEAFTFQLLDHLSELSGDPVQLIIQK